MQEILQLKVFNYASKESYRIIALKYWLR